MYRLVLVHVIITYNITCINTNVKHIFVFFQLFITCLVLVVKLIEAPDPIEVEFGIDNTMNREELMVIYFSMGYTAMQIHTFLTMRHGMMFSLRHLRRLMWRLGLYSRGRPSNMNDIVDAITTELNGSGRLLGYRSMWQRLTTLYGLRVSQNVTRLLLGVMDPGGVALRTRGRLHRRQYICRGPNHVWHIDGLDKLKQFGFAVHACIDGFSRKVLWLHVGRSNNNPAIIAGFYLETIKRLNCVPRIVRSDRGTENGRVRLFQIALRLNHNDSLSGYRSFRYGRSTANQRVECFWSQLRRMVTHFWINFFKDMRDDGVFDNSDPVQVECMRFCFTRVLQADFDRAVELWNNHRIRPQNNRECPSGKPNMMYFLPQRFGTTDQSKPLLFGENEMDEAAIQYCEEYPPYGCSNDFVNVVELIIGSNIENCEMPTTANQALYLYTSLMELIDDL